MRWSVGLEAHGDRVMLIDEIVELADAVAIYSGMATGIGREAYGAQLLVEADSREQAIERATACFERCAEVAGLPQWPIERVECEGEDDEEGEGGVIP